MRRVLADTAEMMAMTIDQGRHHKALPPTLRSSDGKSAGDDGENLRQNSTTKRKDPSRLRC